nr:MAG TPA: hypothetical protein [Caudoviricetes sp.]
MLNQCTEMMAYPNQILYFYHYSLKREILF